MNGKVILEILITALQSALFLTSFKDFLPEYFYILLWYCTIGEIVKFPQKKFFFAVLNISFLQ